MNNSARTRIIIIGAGFGGLYAARTLENTDTDVLLVDRQNFHTFTPLLYQVATCGLEAEEVAYPVRGIFRRRQNVRFMLGEVTSIDKQQKIVHIQTEQETRSESYDYLIVAAGSVTSYFNKPELAKHAFELKTLADAVTLRNHILKLVERAAWTKDESEQKALTTVVVVGGGPTGLETAGAMHELFAHVLHKEYAYLQAKSPRVILVEATSTLLIPFPERLQNAAAEQLQKLGVEVRFGSPVTETAEDHIRLGDGSIISTYTLVWAAGVQASPLAQALDLPVDRNGRIVIKPTIEATTTNKIYVVGDMAYLEDKSGQPYPMLIPVAKQQGTLAAKNILRRINGEPEQTFQYVDRGIMATIGRSRAVAWLFNRIPVQGFLAWLSWLGLHLIALMGFRNRLNVLINWIWNYFTYDRSVRIILEPSESHISDDSV